VPASSVVNDAPPPPPPPKNNTRADYIKMVEQLRQTSKQVLPPFPLARDTLKINSEKRSGRNGRYMSSCISKRGQKAAVEK
jgi:hypothetical protein